MDSLFEIWLERHEQSGEAFEVFAARHAAQAEELRQLYSAWRSLQSALPQPGAVGLFAGDAEQLESRLAAGAVLGDYRLIRRIGAGGMGQVWEAEQLSLRRRVAFKTIRPGRRDSGGERLLREARAAGGINHPGIVPVFAAGEAEGLHFVVQQLVGDGATLADLIDRRRVDGLPGPERLAALFVEIAEALHAAHEAGILHRDLKPRNILIDPGGRPRVGDFGLALRLGIDAAGGLAGTCAYMSPEQAEGRVTALDRRSDVFSLGAVFYEALTLRRPFLGDTSGEVLEAVRSEAPPAPQRLRPELPADLAAICLKALEKEPAARYADMHEFAEDLRRFLAHRPVRARSPGATGRLWRWSRRHPARAMALFLGGLTLVVVAAMLVRESQLRGEAESRAVESRWQSYLANLRAAAAYLQRGNSVEARERLSACAPELRGWEWRHASRFVDADVRILSGHRGGVTAVALTELGAAGNVTAITAGADSMLRSWSASGASVASLELLQGRVRALDVFPGGALLAIGTEAGALQVWDPTSPAPARLIHGAGAAIRAVAFDATGRIVMRCADDATLTSHDLQSGAVSVFRSDFGTGLTSLALSADSRQLVTGSPYGLVLVWPFEAAGEVLTLHGFDRGPAVVAASRDGQRVAAGLPDGSLRTWRGPDWVDERPWPVHGRAVTALALSPDGRWLASASADDEPVALIEIGAAADPEAVADPGASVDITQLSGQSGRVLSLAVSSDGLRVLAGCSGGVAYLWDRRAERPVRELAPPGPRARTLAVSADGRVVASCDGLSSVAVIQRAGSVQRVDLGPASLSCVALDAAGSLLVAGRFDGTVHLWDLNEGARRRVVRVGERPVEAVALVDGGQLVVAAVDRELVTVHADGKVLQRLAAHQGAITGLAVSADGRRAATASVDGTVRAWDLRTGVDLVVQRGESFEDHVVALDAGGRWLAAAQAEGGSVGVFDAVTGEQLSELTDLEAGVPCLAFGDGGRLLFTAGYHGRHLRVWDAQRGENLFDFSDEGGGGTTAMAFAAGQLFLAHADGRILVRDGSGQP
ncbi:MAG: WD40 repeat domain-containing serine/threonine-protein kinase [Planctomycetota bacterium]